MSPKIHHSFWSDSEVEKLNPLQKLAFLWIITNSQMNLCGFCEVSERRFCFDTGIEKEVLASTIEALPRALKHFKETNVILVRQFIRHQFGDGEQLVRNNIFKSIRSIFSGIRSLELRNVLLEDYPILSEQRDEGLPRASKPKEQEQEQKEEGSGGKPTGKARTNNPDDVIAYCQSLGLPASDGTYIFKNWEENGWTRSGKKIKDWKKTCDVWHAGKFFPSQKNPQPNGHHSPQPRFEKWTGEPM